MVGAVPTFNRIPITVDLVHRVQTGSFPPQVTLVQRYVPPVPNAIAYPEEGLVPLANRAIVLQCFQAFKAFVVSLVLFPCLKPYRLILSCRQGA